MFPDAHGLQVTAGSAAAVQAFDHTLIGYLTYRYAAASGRGVRCGRGFWSGALPEGLFRHAVL